ncbi:MAG: 30S ribosomal protein S3 [Nanohaloarchaea archaeon SW_4_43_9]|nr:MAG: 30S ribosomal protein S3 [Nanohaloarchaea archaeon SW_4_43_9]
MQKKEFIEKGARKVKLHEYLQDELEGAGYSHADIVRTPTSTKIVIHAQKPGLVIGRGGSRIKELTKKTERVFDFENPQIEVNEIENPDADAQIVAQSMADWLEKGGQAKRVGYTYLRRVKESGVLGAEIEVSGKLSGNRGRTEKFSFGYVKRCGNTSQENVDTGYKLARTKPGAIGVKVRLMKEIPEFMHRDVDVEKELIHETVEAPDEAEKPEIIAKIIDEAENMTASEIERAVEELEEVQPADVSKEEVRDVFESGEVAEIESEDETEEVEEKEPEETSKGEPDADEETPEPDTEETKEQNKAATEDSEEETDYEDIVSGTISDAKDALDNLDDPDYEAALETEKDNKDRKTFKQWLENKKE